MPTVNALFILLAVAVGFGVFIRVAHKGKSSRVEEFFVGGRNIGAPLFVHATWGSSFAFGNSIFYGAWLGYSLGLSGLWLQFLWAGGMTCYALLLPRLIRYTQHHTLHGFLGTLYGPPARLVASLVSVVGLVILLGFEISFASQYFSQVLGVEQLEWLVVIALAAFIATFCSIGGFKANVLTDKYSNVLAFVSLWGLLLWMVINHFEQFKIGFAPDAIWESATDFSSHKWPFFVGLACFSLFNIVDMSNWQNVSANSFEKEDGTVSKKRCNLMQRAMMRAALLFLLAPVLAGTLLGYMLKLIGRGTDDQPHFMSEMMSAIGPGNEWLALILIAFVTFVFLATSLSGADSWLLASTQTLSWDLFDYKRFKAVGFNARKLPDGMHERITRHARITLLVLGIGGASLIYFISKLWGDVFQLQFVIFGGGLAMLPALLYGIFHGMTSASREISIAAILSIAIGYATALTLFVYSLVVKNPDLTSPLPLVVLGVAFTIFGIGFGIHAFRRRGKA